MVYNNDYNSDVYIHEFDAPKYSDEFVKTIAPQKFQIFDSIPDTYGYSDFGYSYTNSNMNIYLSEINEILRYPHTNKRFKTFSFAPYKIKDYYNSIDLNSFFGSPLNYFELDHITSNLNQNNQWSHLQLDTDNYGYTKPSDTNSNVFFVVGLFRRNLKH